jgi:hypothetical protein
MKRMISFCPQTTNHKAQKETAKTYLGNGQSRGPLVFQDIQANSTIGIDIAVIYFGGKSAFRGLERIVRREVDIQEVHTTSIRRVVRSHDSSLPVEEIISNRAGRAVCWGVLGDLRQLLLNTLESHLYNKYLLDII